MSRPLRLLLSLAISKLERNKGLPLDGSDRRRGCRIRTHSLLIVAGHHMTLSVAFQAALYCNPHQTYHPEECLGGVARELSGLPVAPGLRARSQS